jgi:hypothetical protein
MESVSTKSSVAVDASELANLLKVLENAENKVLEIMKIAEQTCDELKTLPDCDFEKLESLNMNYAEKVKLLHVDVNTGINALGSK